jgi:hypothetical protein
VAYFTNSLIAGSLRGVRDKERVTDGKKSESFNQQRIIKGTGFDTVDQLKVEAKFTSVPVSVGVFHRDDILTRQRRELFDSSNDFTDRVTSTKGGQLMMVFQPCSRLRMKRRGNLGILCELELFQLCQMINTYLIKL